ncbi:fruit body lectin [Xylaria flabelliformis]|nr:fruit body lectin [Xylaria flabelliformis]KAI0855058.1 fruit body lectin [Xylaria cubensis]
MSYTVRVRVRHNKTDAYFHIAEMAVWHYANGGSWANSDGVLKLTMGGSGTSGMLRFQTDNGAEPFTVVMGVHNWKPWVHILPDVLPNETTVVLLPQYYAGGKHSGVPIVPTCNALNSAQRNLSAAFRDAEGRDYTLDLIIG